jgi:hypothetical protein
MWLHAENKWGLTNNKWDIEQAAARNKFVKATN